MRIRLPLVASTLDAVGPYPTGLGCDWRSSTRKPTPTSSMVASGDAGGCKVTGSDEFVRIVMEAAAQQDGVSPWPVDEEVVEEDSFFGAALDVATTKTAHACEAWFDVISVSLAPLRESLYDAAGAIPRLG